MIVQANGFDGGLFETALKRKFSERDCVPNEIPLSLSLSVLPGMNEDEYRVEAGKGTVSISAGGLIGIFSAAGAWLRKSTFDGNGGFKSFEGSFSLKPGNPIHGMYFASHFGNYYVGAPMAELEEYIEDLAFEGCNVLMAWYDMHHFRGIDDSESVKTIARVRGIHEHATAVGMKNVLGTLANEGFGNSPEAFRAEWAKQNGYQTEIESHYHVELCPGKGGGAAEIIRERDIMLSAFKGIRFDYVSIWPYDQGGCSCKECAPWGGNGFLKAIDALLPYYDKVLPNAKILCSTWFFDRYAKGEWDAFAKAFEKRCRENPLYRKVEFLFGYFFNEDTIPACFKDGKGPGDRCMISFPEISMGVGNVAGCPDAFPYGALPWGGFGAYPAVNRLAANFAANRGLYCGALPYSEGIFEDLNKFVMIRLYSDANATLCELLREYARFELCLPEKSVGDFIRFVGLLETTIARHCDLKDGDGPEYDRSRFSFFHPEGIEEAATLADRLDETLSPTMKKTWRWRILYLRAHIDFEILRSCGKPNAVQDVMAHELIALYHAEKADWCVRPVARH